MKILRWTSLTAAALLTGLAWADSGVYRQLGYMYLSPLPGAEYSSPQTRFVLVRFKEVAPTAVTNLSQFIQVTGARSGNHTGLTKIAGDNRTVIFQMSTDFQANELVTVSLNPQMPSGAVQPFQYQFMVSGHMPDPGVVTARGENPPNETKANAFDNIPATKWLDLIVPNGSANFSWIQSVYPGEETHVVNQYVITSASDAPERDPKDWRFYGVDGVGSLTLLDARTNQSFATRLQTLNFSFSNTTAFRGYRLEITKVSNPADAIGVQLAELAFIEPAGTILRQYWTGIPGGAVSDLTANANYPANPSGANQLASFEAPTDWADNYGTRVRGYITAPNTGSFVFWIASDDSSELWLSTNDAPANITLVASVSGWTGAREWNKYGTQKSAPISLVAGQKYYVEARQKEGGGGDNLSVGWAKPGQSITVPSEVIPGSVLSPWTGGNLSAAVSVTSAGPNDLYQLIVTDEPTSSSGPVVIVPVTPVEGTNGTGGSPSGGSNDPSPRVLSLASPGKSGLMPNGVSVPSDFPWIKITTNNNPDPGYIFLDNRGGGGKNYNVIFDNTGSPIWYRRMPDERRDMKVQHNGVLTMLARTGGYRFVGLDNHYEEIASYWAANGYTTDEHELQVLADGTYLLVGLRTETVDMSRYIVGGNPAASVTEQVIQQFTPAGELVFQWRAWDHFDILGQQSFIDLTASSFDFPHINSIDVDTDGHLLISSRSTSELTKINRDTGEIIWRMGGTHNQFTFVNDPLNGPRNQHSFRSVGTNRYTLFDNGNQHSPSVSRAVEYALNLTNMTATVVWQYPPTPTTSLYSYYMGNAQRLPNGNTLINWAIGSLPKLTEVRPDGSKAFEMNWVSQWEAYRVWRCHWQGSALKPYLIVEPYPDNVTLIFNQFGDTNVVTYRIYGGTSPQPTNLLATTGATMKRLTSLENGRLYYFRVTAVNQNGQEGDYSNEENVTVNIIKPGQNMVANGSFSSGTNAWIWTVSGTGSGAWKITNAVSRFDITNGGTSTSSIQLRQAGIPLVQSNKYVFEFDAWADAPRYIEAKVAQEASPFFNYSRIGNSFVTPIPTHFRYVFTMLEATDFNCRVVFNLGTSAYDVYLDNVSLFNAPPGDLNLDGRVDLLDLQILSTDWLKQQGGLGSDLDGSGKVDFTDLGVMGENWSGGN